MAQLTISPGVAIPDGDLILPDFTKHAEFKIHTAAAEIVSESPGVNPQVRAVGSSTIKDRQHDTMEYPALQSMQRAQPGMAIFVNHSYNVPEDLVGKLSGYPEIRTQRDIADLHLGIELLTQQFARAADLYKAIKANVKMGISIGCMIKDAEWRDSGGKKIDESALDIYDVLEGRAFMHILDVEPLEWSFVGIPANQRSWVQYAAQGLFRRSLKQGTPDTKLAPLIRAWFPDDYTKDIGAVADKTARAALHHITPRPKPEGAILWMPATKEFALINKGGRTQTVSRDDVAALVESPEVNISLPDETVKSEPETPLAPVNVLPEATKDDTTDSHDSDSEHGHKHEKAAESEKMDSIPADASNEAPVVVPPVETMPIDPAHVALLTAYNHLGKQLGFTERTWAQKDIVENDTDGQQVISLVSQLDALTDPLRGANLFGIGALVDQLMDVLHIPDADRDSDALLGYHFTPDTQKSGARHSAADQGHVQSIHDHAAKLGATCAGASAGIDSSDEAVMTTAVEEKSSLPEVAKSLESLTTSLAFLSDVPAFLAAVNDAKAQLDTVQKAIAAEQERATALTQANAEAQSKLDAIKGTGLGRPIPAGSSAKSLDPNAAHMPALPSSDPTSDLTRRYVEGVGQCIAWPDGYLAGTRPPLTKLQERILDQMAGGPEYKHRYLAGKDTLVPVA